VGGPGCRRCRRRVARWFVRCARSSRHAAARQRHDGRVCWSNNGLSFLCNYSMASVYRWCDRVVQPWRRVAMQLSRPLAVDCWRFASSCECVHITATTLYQNTSVAGSGLVRIDPLRFLAGCRKRD